MAASGSVLKQKLKGDRPLLFAGVYDALSARIAESAGFDGVWVSGYAVAASMFGKPDIGLITLSEMTDRLRGICGAVTIPVVCDGEVGYGNAINVMRTVDDFIAAGASGMQMGDAEYENCPYLGLPTKPLDLETSLMKIKAVIETRGDRDFLLFGSQVHALERAVTYARAGADGILFPWEPVLKGEDRRWREQLEELRATGAAPVAIQAAFLPPASREDLTKFGYKIIVLAVENLYATAHIQTELWKHYMAHGSVAGFSDRMFTRQDQFLPLVDEEGIRTKVAKFLPKDYQPHTARTQYVRR
jgi:2-methylisocitrate lyase-like PEP mutase family enzyme